MLYVGRVEERKGVHVIVDAFERVISRERARRRGCSIVGPSSYWKRGDAGYYDTLSRAMRSEPAQSSCRGPTYDDRGAGRDLPPRDRQPSCRRRFRKRWA